MSTQREGLTLAKLEAVASMMNKNDIKLPPFYPGTDVKHFMGFEFYQNHADTPFDVEAFAKRMGVPYIPDGHA